MVDHRVSYTTSFTCTSHGSLNSTGSRIAFLLVPEIREDDRVERFFQRVVHSEKRLDGGTRKMVVISNFVGL